MSRGRGFLGRSREAGVNAAQSRAPLPKPDRDPYFNRTAGADQVAPLIAGREAVVMAVEDEPQIVRDYRLRRGVISLERAFQLTGKIGLAIAVGMVAVLALWSGLVIQDRVTGQVFQGVDPRVLITQFGLQASLIALSGTFGWACRGLVRGDRRARLVFTIEAIAAIAASFGVEKYPDLLVVVGPSVMVALLLLWRPRGQLYFADSYRDLVERTPAVTVSRETGRGLATMFLTSLLVIQFADGFLIHRLFSAT